MGNLKLTDEDNNKVDQAKRDNPSCSFSTATSVRKNYLNGKWSNEERFEITMNCLNKPPITIVDRTLSGEGNKNDNLMGSLMAGSLMEGLFGSAPSTQSQINHQIKHQLQQQQQQQQQQTKAENIVEFTPRSKKNVRT